MQKKRYRFIYSLWAVFCVALLQGAERSPVDSVESFSKEIRAAQPGGTIVIADGLYDGWSVELDCRGTAEEPVTIRPESGRGVTFTGRSHFSITGSYVVFDGFHFNGCELDDNLLEFKRSDHCRIANCVFESSGGDRAVIGIQAGARSNSLVDCRFVDISARCVNLHINEEVYKVGIPTGNVIRNNHFQDIPRSIENGRETIKIGTNQPTFGHLVVGTIVEDNVFDRCDGEAEIISNKCSGNIYRGNVFNQCQGELVMRGGSNCLIEGNRILGGSGGIRICGTGHQVRDNIIVNSGGAGIRLYFGMTKEQGGHYQAAGQCLIENNTIVDAVRSGVIIGDSRGKDWQEKGVQDVAPEGNRIRNNIIVGSTGDLLFANHAADNEIEGNLFYKQGSATLSMPGDNPVYADPGFKDPANGDYRPSQGGPALGWTPVKGARVKL